jgi:hypothetical protein
MFKLDNDFLTTLGLSGLPVEEKNKLLQHIYETLEMRVGMRLAEKMTDQQLDEFEGFIDRNDEPGALKWLETNFPNYKDVVAEELEKLKVEVTGAAPQILAAAQANAAQAAQGMPQGQAPPAQFGQAPMQPQAPQGFDPATQPAPSFQPQAPMDQPAPQPMQPPMPPAPDPYAQPQPFAQPQPYAQPQQPAPGFSPAPQQGPQQFTPPPPGFTPGQ